MGSTPDRVNRPALPRITRIRLAGALKVREAITAEALRQLREELDRRTHPWPIVKWEVMA